MKPNLGAQKKEKRLAATSSLLDPEAPWAPCPNRKIESKAGSFESKAGSCMQSSIYPAIHLKAGLEAVARQCHRRWTTPRRGRSERQTSEIGSRNAWCPLAHKTSADHRVGAPFQNSRAKLESGEESSESGPM